MERTQQKMTGKDILKPDLCVIGAGAGGLSVAAGAAQMGANVVLIEGAEMGGDCLNVGCVPSKSILAAGHAAFNARKNATKFGIDIPIVNTDMQKVHDHIQDVISAIAPHDSVERFEGLGVHVIKGYAAFTSPKEIDVNGQKIRAKKFVIATGSVPFIPPISGLMDVPYLTNETIFNLTTLPDHIIIIGGGPIGCEMSQAFCHLGAKVTVITRSTIMPRDDVDIVDIARKRLINDGIDVYEETDIKHIVKNGSVIQIDIETKNNVKRSIIGSHLLVATGRKPNIDGLKLNAANVNYGDHGIPVDAGMRTNNKRIFALGDCTKTYQFTHIAGYQAGIVLQRALFKLPAKANYATLPYVTYTDPEVATVGMNETAAKKQMKPGSYQISTWPYKDNDRAQAERSTDGFIKAIIKPNGRILGMTAVGKGAGELIPLWSLAISKGMKVKDIAQLIVPYPTYSEVSKRVAGSYFTPKIFSPMVKKIVRFIQFFTR
jgi:pyruvate/2-oxoglutarate dehydrogenase complex dihydrolipoamide dehydrogenase (E3) component